METRNNSQYYPNKEDEDDEEIEDLTVIEEGKPDKESVYIFIVFWFKFCIA